MTVSFSDLGLSPRTLKALEQKGFEEPTAIQAACIPLLLKGNKDVVGQAQTGTGKTAAFGLPIIERVNPQLPEVQALVLTPTRELAIQVAEELNSLKGDQNLRFAPIYGGQSFGLQIRKIKEGAQVVVGTPGRILDHLKRRTLKLGEIKLVVLDEADEMLNMGFIDDVDEILSHTPESRRMLLFSATMPRPILALAKQHMRDYDHVSVEARQITEDLTDQIYFEVQRDDKFEALSRIIDLEEAFYGIVFCRTKSDVDTLTRQLQARDYDAEGIHGDINQAGREKVYRQFRDKQITILVATDVAARGIDVSDLTHVVNFSLPQNNESYIHRIGRTGRAGKQGTAITFITPYEYRKLMAITGRHRKGLQRRAVPEVEAVIQAKRDRLMSELEEMIQAPEQKIFGQLADQLLKTHPPQQLVSGLLQLAYAEELDSSGYQPIQAVRSKPERGSVDRKGTNRLFVAKGRKDGLTPRKLVDLITQTAGIPAHLIDDIDVAPSFSLLTVPFAEAETILQAFKHQAKGKRSLIRPDRKSNGKWKKR